MKPRNVQLYVHTLIAVVSAWQQPLKATVALNRHVYAQTLRPLGAANLTPRCALTARSDRLGS